MIIKKVFFSCILITSIQLAQGCLTPYGACINSAGQGGNVEICIEETFNTHQKNECSTNADENQTGYSIHSIYQNGFVDEELLSLLNEDDDYRLFVELEKRQGAEAQS